MQTIIQPQYVDKLKNWFLELFFPSFCLGCQIEGTLLCPDCLETLEISQYRYCLCNKNPLRLPPENKNGKCSRCNHQKLSGLFSALAYQERFLTKKIIHQFKYSPRLKTLAKPLANLLVKHFVLTNQNTNNIWENSILIPVPLQSRRLKYRGYNQSQILSYELGQIINVPTMFDNLIKFKKTESQAKLSAKERQENLRGAFMVKNPTELIGKKIFLVDDVYTTGATLEECASTLKKAGVKQVWGITIAREG